MTHFNHGWDTTRAPAVPVSVGDRYYAQDLNDDFDFLEDNAFALVKGMLARHSSIILDLDWSYNSSTHVLTISKLSVITTITVPTVADDEFSIPPATTTRTKYIVAHLKSSVAVAVPTASSSDPLGCDIVIQKTANRNKALVAGDLDSRVEYVIQNITFGGSASSDAVQRIYIGASSGSTERRFFPTYTDILRTYMTGIAHYDLKKACITPYANFSSITQTFNMTIGYVMNKSFTEYCIGNVTSVVFSGIDYITFVNSTINIFDSGASINGTKLKNCIIKVGGTHPPMSSALSSCEIIDCNIVVNDTVSGASAYAVCVIDGGELVDCDVYIRTISGDTDVYTAQSVGIKNAECRRCNITIDTVGDSSGQGVGLKDTKLFDSRVLINQVGASNSRAGSSGLLNCVLDGCNLSVDKVGGSSGSGESYATDYFLTTCTMTHCKYQPKASPMSIPRIGYQLNGAHNHFASISGSEVSFTKGKYNTYYSYMTGTYEAIN